MRQRKTTTGMRDKREKKRKKETDNQKRIFITMK